MDDKPVKIVDEPVKIKYMMRFQCGCMGIPVDPQDPSGILVFHYCGGECSDEHSPFLRRMLTPAKEEVSHQEAAQLLKEIVDLVNDGVKWRNLKKLLKM